MIALQNFLVFCQASFSKQNSGCTAHLHYSLQALPCVGETELSRSLSRSFFSHQGSNPHSLHLEGRILIPWTTREVPQRSTFEQTLADVCAATERMQQQQTGGSGAGPLCPEVSNIISLLLVWIWFVAFYLWQVILVFHL